ncbi:MAG: hypothetical protein ABII09_03585 [Planctomycetota bacterium]
MIRISSLVVRRSKYEIRTTNIENMAFITIQYDEQQIAAVKRRLRSVPDKMPIIMSRGINNTLKTTRAETVRQLKPHFNLKMKDIRKRIRLYPATRKYWRGKVWIGAGWNSSLASFGARQTTRTHLVTTTPAQAIWLYTNVFLQKYGKKARFSRQYKIKRRIPKVTYDLGRGRQTLEPAWIVRIHKHKHVLVPGNDSPHESGILPSPLIEKFMSNNANMVFVSSEKLLAQARTTITGLKMFANTLLIKNIETQVKMALAG